MRHSFGSVENVRCVQARRLFVLFLVCMLLAEADGFGRDVVRPTEASSPADLAHSLASLLSQRSKCDLDSIAATQNCTAALAAGWERVRRTIPLQKREKAVAPNKEEIFRFLRLVKRQMGIVIPANWEVAVQNANSYGRDNIWFREAADFSKPNLTSTSGNSSAIVRRENGRWTISWNSQTWSVLASDDQGLVEKASVELADKCAYVCMYGPIPFPYKLYALDRNGGNVLWSSDVWASGALINYYGQGGHDVEMRATPDKIAVFGISVNAVYIEVFDRETGHSMCRFSTSYFLK